MKALVYNRIRILIFLFLIPLMGIPGEVSSSEKDQISAEHQLKIEIGQMIMVGIRGSDMDAATMEQTIQQIKNGAFGGILFFKHNIKQKEAFAAFVGELGSINTDYPLLLAIDEEGGMVRRLRKSKGFKEFPSAARIASSYSPEEAFEIYSAMAKQIHSLGLNLNLGPVIDVNVNQDSPVIGRLNRSFSSDPVTVTDYASQFIRAHRQAKVFTATKHYPGHGSSTQDTHTELTDISNTWVEDERIPYEKLIKSGMVDIIMSGHLMNKSIDEVYPASLSKKHIQFTLRDKLGYDGVVMTDDLQMGAIGDRYTLEDLIILAINAGCDILQFSDPLDLHPDLPLQIQSIILQAIKNGDIPEQRIHESFRRITRLKVQLIDPDQFGSTNKHKIDTR